MSGAAAASGGPGSSLSEARRVRGAVAWTLVAVAVVLLLVNLSAGAHMGPAGGMAIAGFAVGMLVLGVIAVGLVAVLLGLAGGVEHGRP